MPFNIQNEKHIELVKKAIAESHSMSGAIQLLGLIPAGGNYQTIKRWIEYHKIDTVHWKDPNWFLDKYRPIKQKKPLQEILIDDIWLNTSYIRKRLINENILENKCNKCGLPPIWNSKPLTMHLDHINGKRNDYRQENLRLLCPNCHSQTDTYTGRNKAASRKPISQDVEQNNIYQEAIAERAKPILLNCLACGTQCKDTDRKYCSKKCFNFSRTGKNAKSKIEITKEDLQELINKKSVYNIAKELGVSHTTILKYCRKLNIIRNNEPGYWNKVYAGKITLTPETQQAIN